MNKMRTVKYAVLSCVFLNILACKTPVLTQKSENVNLPEAYPEAGLPAQNSGKLKWQEFFRDEHLQALIDTALVNNQELNIMLREIEISKNEIQARKGEYLPFVNLRGGMGLDKGARYTSQGALEEHAEMKPGKEIPDPMPDFMVGAFATWEVDIWHKLRNATKSSVKRYLATTEGKNFMVTNLVAEIANSYYELLALDKQLEIINQYISIQNDALTVARLLKASTRSNELAVKRFEAQLLKTGAMQYEVQQKIVEAENRINFLLGRYPQHVERSSGAFEDLTPEIVHRGLPAELLQNRPDIRQAELELAANKLDVLVAKARFYPSLGLTAGVGLQAFNPVYLVKPQSILANIAGEMVGPLINKRAITAEYNNANARQIQSVFDYERTILSAYIEVVNQVSKIKNLDSTYQLKAQEMDALTKSITISNNLFKNARADYLEVLLTQREALETRFELVETKMQQMTATVSLYKALGGGWE
ncbi:TolC family protein [Leadbetterella sp. DM7]|uniref:TolC family protein n=1 Tax=Leadbetterella sp. DM7 TaxID=3235085 RepID=UPI00349EC99C